MNVAVGIAALLFSIGNYVEVMLCYVFSTSAMSLLYECINTVIAVLISISTGMPSHSASIQVESLRSIYIYSSDHFTIESTAVRSETTHTHRRFRSKLEISWPAGHVQNFEDAPQVGASS